ncbi:hypothetical protein HDU93_006079, partial [Gonapodya sp. JEL0774]
PTKESPDNVRCGYCELELDGWEEGDDPLHEHRKRKEKQCPFFTYYDNAKEHDHSKASASKTSEVQSSHKPLMKESESKIAPEIDSDDHLTLSEVANRARPPASSAPARGKRKRADATTIEEDPSPSVAAPALANLPVFVPPSTARSRKQPAVAAVGNREALVEQTPAKTLPVFVPPSTAKSRKKIAMPLTGTAKNHNPAFSLPVFVAPSPARSTKKPPVPVESGENSMAPNPAKSTKQKALQEIDENLVAPTPVRGRKRKAQGQSSEEEFRAPAPPLIPATAPAPKAA